MFDRFKLKIWIMVLIFILPTTPVFAVGVLQDITRMVTIQPIIVSDNNGSNTANFFGSSIQQSEIEGFIDDTWGQAGIDVQFLDANLWNNTFANEGSISPRPGSDLRTIVDTAETAGVFNASPEIINLFFVNIPAGFSARTPNSAAGLAFINESGITQFVGSNLLESSGGREIIADVVAHEIGHNLGLLHTASGIENLMSPNGSGNLLSAAQINEVMNSQFVISAVPAPTAVWLFGSGLIGLASFSRRKLNRS